MLTVQVSVTRENSGKTPALFPNKDFCAARKNILLYPNCEQTSKLLVRWKKSIEFQIIYWEIITSEVTDGSVIFIFFKWRLGAGIIVRSVAFIFVEKFGTKFIVVQDTLCFQMHLFIVAACLLDSMLVHFC